METNIDKILIFWYAHVTRNNSESTVDRHTAKKIHISRRISTLVFYVTFAQGFRKLHGTHKTMYL